MIKLTKESKTFLAVWINLFVGFAVFSLMLAPAPPIWVMSKMQSVFNYLLIALAYATLLSTIFFALYLFIKLIAQIFKDKSEASNV